MKQSRIYNVSQMTDEVIAYLRYTCKFPFFVLVDEVGTTSEKVCNQEFDDMDDFNEHVLAHLDQKPSYVSGGW